MGSCHEFKACCGLRAGEYRTTQIGQRTLTGVEPEINIKAPWNVVDKDSSCGYYIFIHESLVLTRSTAAAAWLVEAKEQNWFAQNFLTNIQFPFHWAQFVIIFLLIEFDGLWGWGGGGEECNVELTTSTAAAV